MDDPEFRTTEDLSPQQQDLALQMAEGLWELLVQERKERSMECIALENVIRLEIADIRSNPRAAGLSEEEIPTNDAETIAMENLVLQTLLERRRLHGGYARWSDWESFKAYMLGKYGQRADA
jgi:hypothetical protein